MAKTPKDKAPEAEAPVEDAAAVEAAAPAEAQAAPAEAAPAEAAAAEAAPAAKPEKAQKAKKGDDGAVKTGNASASGGKGYEPRMKSIYRERIRTALKEQFGYTNEMQIPRLDKIVVNMGIGEAVADSKKAGAAMKDLAAITGQKPASTKARKAIANFKLREGMVVGAKVTLRKDRMYEFLDRLITIALPRVKDFRGLNGASFDGRGNYAMGLKEHLVFPEINYDEIDQVWGMDIVVCTTARTNEEAKALLKEFQFPFAN